MKIAKQITDLIGHTPLVELSKFSKLHGTWNISTLAVASKTV